MTWTDAGFPDIELRPHGKVIYALFLGTRELAAAMGYDLPASLTENFERGRYGTAEPWPANYPQQLDSYLLPLVRFSFKAKFAWENSVWDPTLEQYGQLIDNFLGEPLLTIPGQMLDSKQEFYVKWAKQRHKLIRNMPIYALFTEKHGGAYPSKWANSLSIVNTWYGVDYLNGWIGPAAWWSDYGWRAVATMRINNSGTIPYDFDQVVIVNQAVVNGSDFGTGLQNGQIWRDYIPANGTRSFTYTYPEQHDSISQHSNIYVHVTPHNNPWITGGI